MAKRSGQTAPTAQSMGVYRVTVLTAGKSTERLVLAQAAQQAGNRALQDMGLIGERRLEVQGMRVERLTGLLPPVEAVRQLRRFSKTQAKT
jgi:hypothetical protein